MTARTVVSGMAGATLAISASLPATYDAAGYGATTITYTACGEVEDYGNHGVTFQVAKHVPVDTGVTAKAKGAKDYGTVALVLGNIPADAGQVILKTASESTAHYSVKITYPDTVVHYLDVLVTKFEFRDGDINNIQKIGVELEICRVPVIVAQS